MALSIKCKGSFSADGETMYFQDNTGNYNSSSNTTGWGSPNYTTDTVTSFQIICNWISVGTTVTYNFTVSSNVITAASMIDSAGTTFNILSALTSTTFPFTSSNLFSLTSVYGTAAVLPDLEDGQFQLIYKIIGVYGAGSPPVLTSYNQATSKTYFRDCDLKCCLSSLRLTVSDTNCDCSDAIMNKVNRVQYWWDSALCAVVVGKPNDTALDYFTKAQELCQDGCSEGCD
jgi:hypothetical protein